MENIRQCTVVKSFLFSIFLCLFFLLCPSVGYSETELDTSQPYFMLVGYTPTNFPRYTELNSSNIELINNMPYSGVACPLTGFGEGVPFPRGSVHDDCSSVPDASNYTLIQNLIKSNCKKHIWPLLFFNRLVELKRERDISDVAREYFTRIKIFDVKDTAGALSDFKKLFRLALVLAKNTGSPGIVIDHEYYNNYPAMHVSEIATACNESIDKTISLLEGIGRDLADIIAEEYSTATIMSLNVPIYKTGKEYFSWYEDQLLSMGYIFKGMLKQAQARMIPLKLICGGENEIEYYNETPALAQSAINVRKVYVDKMNPSFSGYFYLGNPITVWNKSDNNSAWMLEKAGVDTPIKNIQDFKPILDVLMNNNNFLWVYTSTVTDYSPFLVSDASRNVHKVLNNFFSQYLIKEIAPPKNLGILE